MRLHSQGIRELAVTLGCMPSLNTHHELLGEWGLLDLEFLEDDEVCREVAAASLGDYDSLEQAYEVKSEGAWAVRGSARLRGAGGNDA